MKREWKKEELTYSFIGRKGGLLILHGFTGTPVTLKRLARHLHKKGLSVSAPLLPGHGEPVEILNQATLEQWIDTADKAFLDIKKSHENVYILGYSLGSLLALELASRREVQGLILISTALRFTQSPEHRRMIAEDTRPLIPIDEIFSSDDPQRFYEYQQWPALAFRQVFSLSMKARRQLPNIHAPVKAFHGMNDTLTPPENIDYLSKNIGSEQIEIERLANSHHRILAGPDHDYVIRKSGEFLDRLMENT